MMLLVLLTLAPCAPTDHPCLAADFEARAREPGISHEQRVQRLYLAHRQHLFLYFETRERRALCDARKALTVARAARPIPADMAPRFEKTDAELSAHERETGVVCVPSHRRTDAAPARVAERPEPPPELQLALPDPPPASSDLLDVPTSRAPVSTVAPPTPGPNIDRPVPAPRPSVHLVPAPRLSLDRRPARPGLGLMITGGVSLALAASFGGVTAWSTEQRDGLQRRIATIRDEALTQGFTTPNMAASVAVLGEAADRARGLAIGAAIATGAASAIGVALLSVGGHRRAASRRLAVRPAAQGLSLHF